MGKIIAGQFGTKKQVIAEKAAILFIEKGFSATSMRDLAESIGIEASSLYNHITGKSEILQEICMKVANLFIANLKTVESEELPVLQKVEKIIRFHIRMMLDEYEIVHISEHEWKHLSEPYLSDFKNQRRNYRNGVSHIIQTGIDSHEIKAVDPYVTVLIILSAIAGIEVWHRSGKGIETAKLEENVVSILIEGIKQRPQDL